MLSIISALKKNLLRSLLLLALSFTALPSAQAGVGDDLLRASDPNLLKFFGIPQDSAFKTEARMVLRPETPYLSEVTQLRVRINDNGNVERMELWMDSSFMQDEWVRAYDLASWFLASAVPQEEADAVKLFKMEIDYPQDKEVHYKNIQLPAELPASPTRAYMAFRGDLPTYEQRMGESTLRMEHTTIGGRTWLRMIVADQNSPALTSLTKGPRYKL